VASAINKTESANSDTLKIRVKKPIKDEGEAQLLAAIGKH